MTMIDLTSDRYTDDEMENLVDVIAFTPWDDSRLDKHLPESWKREAIALRSAVEAFNAKLKSQGLAWRVGSTSYIVDGRSREKRFFESEIVTLEGFLSEISEDRVIERAGFERRLKDARERLAELEND